DELRALSNLHRVLRAGGRVALSGAAMCRPQPSGELAGRSAPAGLGAARAVGALGQTLREEGDALGKLLHDAGFVDVAVREHTVVDTVSGVDDWLVWRHGGSCGNPLAGMRARELRWVRARLSLELELFRTPRGIRLERCMVFATARRPA
ncbi:MAG TPA: methyltransferase, partial [Polyangiaceae bacterium]|nr:methyltransferase [Polyangiaceae bacterium]